jgi:hypothetical protein
VSAVSFSVGGVGVAWNCGKCGEPDLHEPGTGRVGAKKMADNLRAFYTAHATAKADPKADPPACE